MIRWLKKKQNPAPKQLKNPDELQNFIDTPEIRVVGFFQVLL